jgi:hypothetical protein
VNRPCPQATAHAASTIARRHWIPLPLQDTAMMKLHTLSGRALDLAEQVGDNMKVLVPRAQTLLATGAKLGALKTGARVAGMLVRRHPAIMVATVAGAGLLWYAAKRRARRAEQGDEAGNGGRQAIEGRSKRVDARNGNAGASAGGRKTAGARKRAAGGRAARSAGSEGTATTH